MTTIGEEMVEDRSARELPPTTRHQIEGKIFGRVREHPAQDERDERRAAEERQRPSPAGRDFWARLDDAFPIRKQHYQWEDLGHHMSNRRP